MNSSPSTLASLRIRCSLSLGRLGGETDQVLHLQGSRRDHLAHGLAAHELHHQIQPVGRASDLVDGDDVRVVQGRGRPRFALEPLDTSSDGGNLFR